MTTWIYDSTINPDEFQAFVYLITCTLTGRQYIGKKFTHSRVRKQVKTSKGTKRNRIMHKASDWQSYRGSCKELLSDLALYGEANFRREIIHWCRTRGEANYLEAREQFARDVLRARLPDGTRAYYNQQILRQFYAPKS